MLDQGFNMILSYITSTSFPAVWGKVVSVEIRVHSGGSRTSGYFSPFRTISLVGLLVLSYKYAGLQHLWGRLLMELRRFRYLCLCLIVLLGTVQLWADVTGSILGYVRDKSCAVLPSATVTAIQTATG